MQIEPQMTSFEAEYDYIIVGAGSSGGVLADRLSADGKSSVLVIEAGKKHETELVNMPRAFIKIWGKPGYFWHFPVKAQKGRSEGETWVYGKGLGGSSSTNGTWYLRGMAKDYDSWHAMGLKEWSWSEILRCYQSLESYRYPHADPSRGADGPVQITDSLYRSPVIAAIMDAGEQFGLPRLGDINTPNTDGIGYTQATIDRKARRSSTYRALLKPAMRRRNLTVMTETLVERVIIEDGVAVGVRCRTAAGIVNIRARGEVILSAGVLQSPKLLQLSGIGPAEVLAKVGVPLVKDMPEVGRNLAEHAMFSISFRLKNDWGANREFSGWRLSSHVMNYYIRRKGMMAFTTVEVTALAAMKSDRTWPDVQMGISPFSMRSSAEVKADPGRGMLEDQPGFTINGFYLRPKSRGTVAIESADIDVPIGIDANWWGHPDDMPTAVEMLRLMRRFAAQPALSHYIGEEVVPGAAVESDEQIANTLQWLVSPGLHGTGTCRMGEPGSSVLDSRLRVHGIGKLRVVDCSSMPTQMSGNTNGPAMVLGVRAAELILEDRDNG